MKKDENMSGKFIGVGSKQLSLNKYYFYFSQHMSCNIHVIFLERITGKLPKITDIFTSL